MANSIHWSEHPNQLSNFENFKEDINNIISLYNDPNNHFGYYCNAISSTSTIGSLTYNLKVYPNPSTGRLKLSVEDLKINKIQVRSLTGQLLSSPPFYLTNELSLDLSM